MLDEINDELVQATEKNNNLKMHYEHNICEYESGNHKTLLPHYTQVNVRSSPTLLHPILILMTTGQEKEETQSGQEERKDELFQHNIIGKKCTLIINIPFII